MTNQTPEYNPKTEPIPKVYGSMPPLGEQEATDDIPKYRPEQDEIADLYGCEIDFDLPDDYNNLGAEKND